MPLLPQRRINKENATYGDEMNLEERKNKFAKGLLDLENETKLSLHSSDGGFEMIDVETDNYVDFPFDEYFKLYESDKNDKKN